ncbi:MAG TPA: hypothetical protein VMR75_01405 [Candidatus Saccharimonadales bacterium]|nr:hypothetical protein [Candidatus Saccharimonadales bacterium]
MLLTNHTLTGLVLSRLIPDPVLLAPAALASHLALDSLPHFGHPKWPFKSPQWIKLAVVDNLVALTLFIGALIYQPQHWVQILIGVFFATLPDLLFLLDIFLGNPVKNAFTRLHSRIQWHESVSGAAGEVMWATLMSYLLVRGL